MGYATRWCTGVHEDADQPYLEREPSAAETTAREFLAPVQASA